MWLHAIIRTVRTFPLRPSLVSMGTRCPISIWTSWDDQPDAHLDVRDIFGEEYVFRAGTVGTVVAKQPMAFCPWLWAGLWKFYKDVEVERLGCWSGLIKRTTGQHLVVSLLFQIIWMSMTSPRSISSGRWQHCRLANHPLQLPRYWWKYPQARCPGSWWSHHGSKTPATVRDWSKIYSLGWSGSYGPLGDRDFGVEPEQIGTPTGMLGIPEFGTNFVRGMVEETHPTTFSELLQLSGLSMERIVWLGNAQDLIKAGIADLSTVIGCRDDIMVYLMHAGPRQRWPFF